MTDTQALRDLLVKVEAAAWWGDLPRPDYLHTDLCWKAFNGSLDAAKALHDAVLPGWQWGRLFTGTMWVEPPDNEDGRYRGFRPDNPARAWLIAILRALIAVPVAENEGGV